MAEYFIGLISGTSLDAVDAALLRFDNDQPTLEHQHSHALPTELRDGLIALCQPGGNEIERMGRLDVWLGEVLADAAQTLLTSSGIAAQDIRAIGSHGQTIRHLPEGDRPFTLQIGDPNQIAERTGITTVADFRRRDMAAGGEAAPLVPAFHQAVFHSPERTRVIVNIGGIGNITVLPANASLAVTGFDTGPGNGLMDGWIQQHQQAMYDDNGAWAAGGTIHQPLLKQLLSDEYLATPPPKSTGREHYHAEWLQQQLAVISADIAAVDVQSTLCEFTVQSIADAIDNYALNAVSRTDVEIFVCGGGAYNGELMRRLGQRLAPVPLRTTAALGIDPEWVEASAFAWLARQTLRGLPGNIPAVTGARHPVVLGGIYRG